MAKRESLDGPWECSWCGFKSWDIVMVVEHENKKAISGQNTVVTKKEKERDYDFAFDFIISRTAKPTTIMTSTTIAA